MSRPWQSWPKNGTKGDGKRKGRPPQDAEKEKPKDKGNGLPGYDSVAQSSSATSSKEAKLDDSLKIAMRELLQSNKLAVPVALKDLLEKKPNEDLNTAQKQLNAKRKLLQKLDRLQAAKERKALNWEQFKESMKEHFGREKTRFETEQEELEMAIKETQLSLDKMTDPDAMVQEIPEEETDEFSLLLENDKKPETTEKTGMESKYQQQIMEQQAEMIKQAQVGQAMLAKQMADMQEQMAYFVAAHHPPMLQTPPRASPMSTGMQGWTPEQPPKLPYSKPDQEQYGKQLKNPAIRTQPYSKETKEEKNAGTTEVINLEKMDGKEDAE